MYIILYDNTITVQYKTLEGETFGKFGELQAIHQKFLVQILLPKSRSI